MITYNHGKYMEKALDSVLGQETDFKIEVIVGEDCSTDNTRAILESYHQRWPETVFPVYRRKNIGMAKNFMECWSMARGEYVALLEGDDYWLSKDKLRKQVELFRKNPSASIVFHNVSNCDRDGHLVSERFVDVDKIGAGSVDDLLKHNFIPTCSSVIRRAAVKELPRWFLRMPALDWPLHVIAASHGKIVYIDDVMAVYRSHGEGAWSKLGYEESLRKYIEILDALKSHFEGKHCGVIDAEINRILFLIATQYEIEGKRKEALLILGKIFKVTRGIDSIRRNKEAKLLLKILLPSVSRLVKKLKATKMLAHK